MPKILVIEGDKVTPLDKTKFTEEGKLQDYLEKYPSLIPLGEIIEGASDLLCIGREVGAGPGSIDLLFIDKGGLLTVVETKLAKNPEGRRTVIGQIIEYASYISQWTADDVYRIANAYLEPNLEPNLDEAMEKINQEEFSADDFRSNIGQNLKNGNIRLIIAVDELIEPLRATVTFLNRNSNFDILLLQVSNFEESKTRKVLIPLLFGYATKTTTISPQRKRWDLKRFLVDTGERCDKEAVEAITKLYDFTTSTADSINWGTGASLGSFTFRKLGHETLVSIYTVYSDGSIQLNFGEMKGKKVKEEVLQSFRAQLNEIPNVKILEEAISLGKFPYIMARVLTEADNLKNFQDAVLALCQQIESSER